jgi:signal transduction histidine kinase
VRLWPRSLVGQLMLAVALTLFVAQSANLWLLDRAQRQQFVAQVGGVAAARIIDVLERERSSGRSLTELTERRGRIAVSTTMPVPPPGVRAMPRLAAHVQQILIDNGVAAQDVRAWIMPGAGERRAARRLPRRAEIVVFDGRRWITVRGRAPASGERLSSLLIGQTLLLYLVLLVPILLIGWRVSRPLGELTASVRRARPGDRADSLRPRGPADVQDLMSAFNDFRGRIDTMMTDKDRMLGAVGHDLRTPLASLRVRVEQVEDDVLRAKMVASIDAMAAMLTDILALARSGAGIEAPMPVRLGAWLDTLVAEYAERQLAVTRVGGADDTVIIARTMVLARALRNLIDNAIVYGQRAEVRIETDALGTMVIVADEGPGIDPARVAEMMQPFARGEESRSRETGGSGLGLALAKMVADSEGGSLELANRTDRSGLEARLRLPRQQ